MYKKYLKYIWIICLFIVFHTSQAKEGRWALPLNAMLERADAHCRKALIASYHVNTDEAIGNLKMTIDIDPAFVIVYDHTEVEIFRKQQHLDDEIRTIKKSLEINPQEPELLYRLGEIYVEKKKEEEALKAFQDFLLLDLVNDFLWSEDELLKAGEFIADYYGYRLISGEALLDKIQKNAKYTLIDCRPSEEYAAGHIPGAVNVSIDSYGFSEETPIKASMNKIIQQVGREIDFILIDADSGEEYMPRTKLLELLNALPEDRAEDIILYCRKPSCTRSRLAARWLVLLGYKNVYRYAGSWKEWSNKGYPSEK